MGDEDFLTPRPNISDSGRPAQRKNTGQFKRNQRGDISQEGDYHNTGYQKRQKRNHYDENASEEGWKTERSSGRDYETPNVQPQHEGMIKYIQALYKDVQRGADKDLCCRNMLSAVKGHELDMMCNSEIGFILEKTVAMCKPHQLIEFTEAVAACDISTACTVGCSSFVMQALLLAALKNFAQVKGKDPESEKKREEGSDSDNDDDDDIPQKEVVDKVFTHFVEQVSQVLIENLSDVVCHRNASPVLRNLFQVLGGCFVGKEIVNSKKIRKRQEEVTDSNSFKQNSTILSSVDVPPSFRKILKTVVKTLKTWDSIGDFLWDDKAAPALEILLLILHRVDQSKCFRLIGKLTEGVPNLDEHSLNRIGSYVLQKVVSLCDEDLFAKLWSERFKGQVKMLATHSVGNYIVKEICARCANSEQLAEIFEEFAEVSDGAWKMGHYDIFVGLSDACVRLKSSQKKFIKMLQRVLECKSKPLDTIPLLASQLNTEEYEKLVQQIDQLTGETGWREQKDLTFAERSLVKLHGSLIIQSMCKFEKTSKICKSILSIPGTRLVRMLCSAPGSFIMNAYMESTTVSTENKEAMSQLLRGFYVGLAIDKFGSRVIEVMWQNLDVANRTAIMEELAQNKSSLQSSSYGYIILNKFEYLKFAENKEAWARKQGSYIKTKNSFEAMLKGII